LSWLQSAFPVLLFHLRRNKTLPGEREKKERNIRILGADNSNKNLKKKKGKRKKETRKWKLDNEKSKQNQDLQWGMAVEIEKHPQAAL